MLLLGVMSLQAEMPLSVENGISAFRMFEKNQPLIPSMAL